MKGSNVENIYRTGMMHLNNRLDGTLLCGGLA